MGEMETNYQCGHCGVLFDSMEEAQQHMLVAHINQTVSSLPIPTGMPNLF